MLICNLVGCSPVKIYTNTNLLIITTSRSKKSITFNDNHDKHESIENVAIKEDKAK